ncbi:hypothetical protein QTO34_009271 [Cnephaeus nilssonii]|uniref:phosphatidylinositol-3,5-bisphosphate 3-phosphatase n=1 Tax=Cnephaeus nilssonii TaxID=3371016 RepID=A0AA40LGT4_CNENI|nr:hypothetical protein QTO34_009271 [Eptesicus nilssonii]
MSLTARVSCSMLSCFGEEGPPSLEYIQAKDLFPPKELVKEEENLQVPFTVLQGEGVEFLGRAADALIAISNYRLHIKFKDSVINVPLRMIDSVESRDMFQLHIACKDSKVVRCHFSTFKQCQEWLSRLSRATARPAKPEDLFAFAYHAWCLGLTEEDQHTHLCQPGEHIRCRQEAELVRMGFDLQNVWRISHINSNYKLCPSYPQKLLVPVWITDKELENVASFRSWKRIPVVVYRHLRNGAAIARCSQPEISWWGWRNADDEYLVTSIAKACALDPGTRATGGSLGTGNSDASEACDTDFDSSLTACSGVESTAAPQKLLILDARSYTAAVANRAKGGGCECEEYYPNCEVVFMGMANIHAIRNSFQYLRAVCSQMPDPSNWLSALESTKWLQHLSMMLKAAVLVANTVDREGRPVLVHCSDGWDRTPQIVALAKILLDPYYRTLEGFQVLVESDWLDFGHKFGDRCGHQENAEDQNEQCPVFLQWLDSVHQLLKQFPCLFEFNEAFLVKLVQHTYSCLYGTFLANNPCEREKRNIYKRTCSVWALLRAGNKNFHNFLYTPGSDMVLHPVCHVRALHLWTAVYLPASSPCTLGEENMDLYLSPVAQSQEFSGRSLDRSQSGHPLQPTECYLPNSSDPSTDFVNQDPPESVASISHQEQPSSVPDLIDGEEDTDKRGNNRNGQLLENPRFGKVSLDLARKPISQSQIMPPLYLDDDGLPFPTDVIQHRLRQIEAGYKQEVEQLRRQVRELQMRLDIRHCCAPPAEPPMDYEDDFTCLKESDGSDTEDFGSDHSEDCLSEASWEPVDKKETEVTRWVPDHMASHCYNCDCEFWLAKRRHHCRNCGNVFCAGCCHLKLPIPDQQLYDPVLVCNSCYEHIQVSRARELMSQHLKKPIATASS